LFLRKDDQVSCVTDRGEALSFQKSVKVKIPNREEPAEI
jgi:hypothetical protein